MTRFGRSFEELSRIGVEAELSADALLWKEGDPPGEVVLLLDGVLEVMRDNPEGETIVVRTLDAGAILGEIATLDGRARSAAVRASTPCRILRVPGAAFRDLIHARPDLLEELFWQQMGWIRSLTEQVARTQRPSILDGLTRLYTERFFKERLRSELERAREVEDNVSVVVLEVGEFARYRAAQGLHAADDAVARLAQVLRSAARKGDLMARFGTARFGALLYGAARTDAERLVSRLRRRLDAARIAGTAALPEGRLSVYTGIATFPADGTRVETLLEAADAALAEEAERERRG
jgi:diguanylate cyclase (GGDEF)-like protein